MDYPAGLVYALQKKEVVLFFGGDLLKQFSITNFGYWPRNLTKKIADYTDYYSECPLEFFKVAEYAKYRTDKRWVIQQIHDLYSNLHINHSPSLESLLGTDQKLAISTWFDTSIIQIAEKIQKNVQIIINTSDLNFLKEDNNFCLFYLFGSINDFNSLVIDTQEYHNRLQSGNRIFEYIKNKLAPSTLLFIGYDDDDYFNFEDFYERVINIYPSKFDSTNYAIMPSYQDLASIERLKNRNLNILITEDVSEYINELSMSVIKARNNNSSLINITKPLPKSPYKNLDWYTVNDQIIFFGRDKDISKIIGLIHAHSATIIYGPSGSGKTSLLQAGVGSHLMEKGGYQVLWTRVLPDPQNALNIAISKKRLKTLSTPSGYWLDIIQKLIVKYEKDTLIIIFDQFEEFFVELSNEIQAAFWNDVARCLNDQIRNIRIVFCIRQEALYMFNNAFPALPKPFDAPYYVSSLDISCYEEVINGPLNYFQYKWSQELVEKIINYMREFPGETAHLSLVMSTLWRKKRKNKSDVEIYDDLGGVKGILTNYLEYTIHKMKDPDKVEQILKCFVSPEKRKSQISLVDIFAEVRNRYTEISIEDIQNVLKRLVTARLIRAVHGQTDIFELAHDILAVPIAEKITDEEMQKKIAKRTIREAEQEWKFTGRLPNRQEYEQIMNEAIKTTLINDDLIFLCLVAAHNGMPIDQWVSSIPEDELIIEQFYDFCINSESIFVKHELLRQIVKNYISKHDLYLEKLAISTKPSIVFHLHQVLNELIDFGYYNLRQINIIMPARMITIPGGKFIFGKNIPDNDGRRKLFIPETEIFLDDFEIDRFLVTNIEYKKFVDATKHRPPENWKNGEIPFGKEYHPVTNVSWFDAAEYALYNHKRLPTEAEWEKAAYWDPDLKVKHYYPWGDNFIGGNANYFDSHIGTTTPIGQFSPQGDSRYGITDMAGNVFEWLLDDAVLPFHSFSTDQNPCHISGSTTKMTRGGSYGGPQKQLHCTYREYERNPIISDNYVGFRCVISENRTYFDLLERQLESRITGGKNNDYNR